MGRSDTLMASTLYISPIRRTTLARGRLQRALAIGVCLALLPDVARSQDVIKPSAGAGTTQVIGVTAASDGALRVIAIPVTVP